MASDDFESQLESIAERAISADSRSNENSRDLASFKKIVDAHQVCIDRLHEKLAADKQALDELREVNQVQARDIVGLSDAVEQQKRLIEALTDRLNGKGLIQIDAYERVVSQVRQIAETLGGGEGQLSFSQLRNSIQQTQFLGQTIRAMIGLFGVGGVLAAGTALVGGSKVSPEVQALEFKVADIQGDVKRLQSDWQADLQRRLTEAGKK